ncbi:hypothetical protein Tco_0472407 [Tanacetum coccineum]
MVAYLKKTEGSEGFHQIFWQTATASTLNNGEMEITATIDGKVKIVTEQHHRGHLMGLIFQGKRSTVPVESHHTPTGAPSTSQPHLSSTLRSSIRQETEVPQPSSPPHTNVADEAASTHVDVIHGGATTTITSLDAGQGSDRVVALETDLQQTKKVYGAAFTKLIKKVKWLEKKDKLSKSRRKLRPMGAQTQGSYGQDMEYDTSVFDTSEVFPIQRVSTASTDFTTANVPVTTAGAEISTASPEVKTAGDSVDDIDA